jgi:hypothetical protein
MGVCIPHRSGLLYNFFITAIWDSCVFSVFIGDAWKLGKSLGGIFFLCRVFVIKSVQNSKSFWLSSQNCFVLALFSSLYISGKKVIRNFSIQNQIINVL